MIALIFFSVLLWDKAEAWGFKDGVLHNSIWLEEIGCILILPTAVGDSRVTLLTESCCLWTSRRNFKKCELEGTCPVSPVSHVLLRKNQRKKWVEESQRGQHQYAGFQANKEESSWKFLQGGLMLASESIKVAPPRFEYKELDTKKFFQVFQSHYYCPGRGDFGEVRYPGSSFQAAFSIREDAQLRLGHTVLSSARLLVYKQHIFTVVGMCLRLQVKAKFDSERAAGVYHRESRTGKYQLTYAEAKAVCEYEGGHLATYQQLEAARKIGFHVCAAGWMAKGRVGYPIVKAGPNCGFGKTGIVDYGIRLNRSERWDAYCYNPNGKECGGVFTDSKHVFKSPGYPNEYENEQICYWHIRVKYGQRIHLQFLEFDVEDDTACMADFLEIYDSYDDINGFVGRFCGDELPDDIISTGNVMTLKFLTDASVTAGGFQIRYVTMDMPSKSGDGKNTTSQGKTNFLSGKFGIM